MIHKVFRVSWRTTDQGKVFSAEDNETLQRFHDEIEEFIKGKGEHNNVVCGCSICSTPVGDLVLHTHVLDVFLT